MLLSVGKKMDVINKFYSSMQTTVSQISSVLPGNNVTREYEVIQEVASCGIGNYWKIYSGYKKSTRQEVSVFVFEKKLIEKWSKEDREYLLNLLRHGVHQLTKMKHPRILTVQHPLEESRYSLAFASEPVVASLANIVDDISSTSKLYSVEITHGIQQLIDGLVFLHQDANIIHGNLCPESILIDKQRNWKVFGLDFSMKLNCKNEDLRANSKMNIPAVNPSLEYLAPERIKKETQIVESDLYSLGMIIYFMCTGKPLKQFENNFDSFTQFAKKRDRVENVVMDEEHFRLKEVVTNLINPNPISRPRLEELKKSAPFQEIGVKTLIYLDGLYQWDNLQKSTFYKGLMQIIPTFPHRVNVYTVIPQLAKEFVNLPMVPFILPNILLIASMSTHQEYSECILPYLKMVFGIQEPIQVLWIFMQKMDVLLKLTSSEDVKKCLLPLFHRAIESEVKEIQEMCLQAIPSLLPLIDSNSIRNTIMPRIKALCLRNVDICVKVKCLLCIGRLLEFLDKWILVSDVLPFLELIDNREPAVIMAMIGIHKIALTHQKLGIGADVMARKCIPFLSPLLMENTLSIAQFNCIVAIIQEMFERVEKEQKIQLERLSSVKQNFSTTCKQMTVPQVLNQFEVNSESKNVLEKESLNNTSNPLVITRQLTAPTREVRAESSNNLSVIQPINYIYQKQHNIDGNVICKSTSYLRLDKKQTSPQKSELVSLTEQEILNFLK